MALSAIVTALVVAPLTAVASHGFDDVPNSHTFHEDIGWLADAGVTRGCNPPTNDEFCPEDNVTRGQMGAFIRRFAQYIGAEDGTPAQADNANNLNGKDATAYETRIVADGCRINATGTATSCPNDGAAPDQTTIELARVTVNAPSSGTVVIAATAFANTSNWFTLNESCASYVPPFSAIRAQAINGLIFTSPEGSSAITPIEVSSGDKTIRICSAYEGLDGGGAALGASLTVTWAAGGSVSISETASSNGAPLGNGPLLGDLKAPSDSD